MRRSLVVQVYDPVVQWASAALHADFEISDSIFGTQQPEKAAQAVGRYLEGVGPCTIPSVKLMDIRTSKLGSEDAWMQAFLHGSLRPQSDSSAHADPSLWVWQCLRYVCLEVNQ